MLPDLDVDNVFLYVADAVRWDSVPDDVVNKGFCVKTVAGGIHTPTSLAGLVSGTYLPNHGVRNFGDVLSDRVYNLLHESSFETAFINSINDVRFDPSESADIIADTLNVEALPPDRLEDIEPPFLCVERGPGGHAPYGRRSKREDGTDYYEDRHDASRHQFVREYRESVTEDSEWFASRLAALEERGLLNDTLVIYTSDHGELLGEEGMLGHSPPIHPNHVYVPTVFIHPDLCLKTIKQRILRHIDIVPTILSALNIKHSAVAIPDGRDLTQEQLSTRGACFHTLERKTPLGGVEVPFDSLWSPTGGYVFPRSGRFSRILLLHLLVNSLPWSGFTRRHLPAVASFVFRGTRCHGAPLDSASDARSILDTIWENGFIDGRTERKNVPEERLRELGYLE